MRAIVATTEIDQRGERFTEGCLEQFVKDIENSKNPLITNNFNYTKPPVGKFSNPRLEDGKLSVEIELINDTLHGYIAPGLLIKDAKYNADKDYFIIKDAELAELSLTQKPTDSNLTLV